MDSYAIASAIATRFGATTPPAGQEAIKLATAELPDEVSLFPSLLVFPSTMSDPTYIASKRDLNLTFPVAFVLSRADGSPRRAHALHDWVTVLYGRIAGQIMLGLSSYVSESEVLAWTPGVSYGGQDYDGALLTVWVHVNEPYSPAA